MSAAHRTARALAAVACGRLVTGGVQRWLVTAPPGGAGRWTRTNFRGAEVTLLAGPALAAGLVAGAVTAGGAAGAAAAVAGLGAGSFGLLDDLTGTTHARGFRGHLRALRDGELTSGLVKLAGIGATGLAAALVLHRRPTDVALTGALVAGTANLANLLDLRPGRALKSTALLAVPAALGDGPGRPVAGGLLGATLAVLPADLGERAMLGDTGANAAGAVAAVAIAAGTGRGTRAACLAVVVALTAASERVSFSAVIDRTPALRALDRLGRRP